MVDSFAEKKKCNGLSLYEYHSICKEKNIYLECNILLLYLVQPFQYHGNVLLTNIVGR